MQAAGIPPIITGMESITFFKMKICSPGWNKICSPAYFMEGASAITIRILLVLSLVVPLQALAATAEPVPPAALKILHTADGRGEISPCG